MPLQLPLRPLCRLISAQPQPTLLALRPFSTTPLLSGTTGQYTKQARVSPPIPSVRGSEPQIPSYPYGDRQVYKQSNTGLYGLARIRFGNIVSPKYEVKTRRKWRVNIHRKRLWSASLKAFVQTRVTTRVMRTIDKVGGLDEYLLGQKPGRVKELGPWGWRLRWRVMQTGSVKRRFAEERKALGLAELTKELAEVREREELRMVGGESVEGLRGEIDAVLASGEEVPLGEEEVGEEGFMKEEGKSKA
ncbi:ribosomal L28 family-domain-containing protein [Coniochaeta sp. 2T2.1]|nr:ribosomal L28 family-domain-containing protein [Coniochaeta sp. 2T2.1]